MSAFELHILGCGSALPTRRHNPSAQIVNVRGKLFLIDCGEGTQLQIRNNKLNFNKIQDVFLSHLHGDHCFGLIGLISTMGMLGRNNPLRIHGPKDTEQIFRPLLDYFCAELPFEVCFDAYEKGVHTKIFEDSSIEVFTLPLKHRVPTSGFLFREKDKPRHIRKDMLAFYGIPLNAIPSLQEGADYTTEEGEVISNERLTMPATTPKSYAYCSDTAWKESLIPLITGVDLLYHEATFLETHLKRAQATQHSTAAQAGRMARLAEVKALLIGHYSARYSDEQVFLDEARVEFSNVRLAMEGLKLDI